MVNPTQIGNTLENEGKHGVTSMLGRFPILTVSRLSF